MRESGCERGRGRSRGRSNYKRQQQQQHPANMDIAVAAAFAGGRDLADLPPNAYQAPIQRHSDPADFDVELAGELPSVDDLEIAAAAADALPDNYYARAGSAVNPATIPAGNNRSDQDDSSVEDNSSEGEESSGEGVSGNDSDEEMLQAHGLQEAARVVAVEQEAEGAAPARRLAVRLEVTGDRVKLHLTSLQQLPAIPVPQHQQTAGPRPATMYDSTAEELCAELALSPRVAAGSHQAADTSQHHQPGAAAVAAARGPPAAEAAAVPASADVQRDTVRTAQPAAVSVGAVQPAQPGTSSQEASASAVLADLPAQAGTGHAGSGSERDEVDAMSESSTVDFALASEDDSDDDSDDDADNNTSDTSDESDVPVLSREEMHRLIDEMDVDADDPAEKEATAKEALPPAEPLDVVLSEDDVLRQAGSISAIVEGTVVVQALELARALDEGTVLALQDRTPLGRVQEVFGPVQAPLYALRYAGPQPMPDSVARGARVFSVDKYCSYVLPEKLAAKGYDAAAEDPDAEEEFDFSDDEKEAEFRRQLKAANAPASSGNKAPGPSGLGGGRSGRRGGGRGRHANGSGGGRAPARHQQWQQQQQQQSSDWQLGGGQEGSGYLPGGGFQRGGRGAGPQQVRFHQHQGMPGMPLLQFGPGLGPRPPPNPPPGGYRAPRSGGMNFPMTNGPLAVAGPGGVWGNGTGAGAPRWQQQPPNAMPPPGWGAPWPPPRPPYPPPY